MGLGYGGGLQHTCLGIIRDYTNVIDSARGSVCNRKEQSSERGLRCLFVEKKKEKMIAASAPGIAIACKSAQLAVVRKKEAQQRDGANLFFGELPLIAGERQGRTKGVGRDGSGF